MAYPTFVAHTLTHLKRGPDKGRGWDAAENLGPVANHHVHPVVVARDPILKLNGAQQLGTRHEPVVGHVVRARHGLTPNNDAVLPLQDLVVVECAEAGNYESFILPAVVAVCVAITSPGLEDDMRSVFLHGGLTVVQVLIITHGMEVMGNDESWRGNGSC